MFTKLGLTEFESVFGMEGPIIGGHVDRHVLRLTIGSIPCLMKREHRILRRDRLAGLLDGFGPVSVSLREAITLDELSRRQLPVPEWIAVGESAGQAFLILKESAGAIDLRDFLMNQRPSTIAERRQMARELAKIVASVHNKGVDYPDLYAKHVLFTSSNDLLLVDWQRSRLRNKTTWNRRCHDLAALHASLPKELADDDSRLAFLVAYLRDASEPPISVNKICQKIQQRAIKLLRRSSIRDQWLPKVNSSQTLYWFNRGEICMTPLGKNTVSIIHLEKLLQEGADGRVLRNQVLLIDKPLYLTRRRTVRKIGTLLDRFRTRGWQSPECRMAADLLRRERLGEPKRLIAFGQREIQFGVFDSFILQVSETLE